jgi:hypothetical protein
LTLMMLVNSLAGELGGRGIGRQAGYVNKQRGSK